MLVEQMPKPEAKITPEEKKIILDAFIKAFGEKGSAKREAEVQRMAKAINKFIEAGVGLLAVADIVTVICGATINEVHSSRMTKKLWRRRDEWKGRIDSRKFKRRKGRRLITRCY
jgi:hypothetical protein